MGKLFIVPEVSFIVILYRDTRGCQSFLTEVGGKTESKYRRQRKCVSGAGNAYIFTGRRSCTKGRWDCPLGDGNWGFLPSLPIPAWRIPCSRLCLMMCGVKSWSAWKNWSAGTGKGQPLVRITVKVRAQKGISANFAKMPWERDVLGNDLFSGNKKVILLTVWNISSKNLAEFIIQEDSL